MKHYIVLFLIGIGLVLMNVSCSNSKSGKVIYLAHNMTTSHPVHKGILEFASQMNTLSSGKLKVKIFPDGQLGTEREVLELLQIGSLMLTKVSAAALANFVPEYKVLGVPYLFRDKQHMFEQLEGDVGKDLLAAGSTYNLRGLCFFDAGSRSFYTKDRPIQNADDLKGMKIRVMNHQMSVNMVNLLGASATPMAFGELYTALQQGVVDGAENNPPSFVSSRHFEVCKYYTIDEHSSIPDVLVISNKYWERLSSQEQVWVQQAAYASAQAQKQYWKADVEQSFNVLKKAGVEIINPDKTTFQQKTLPIIEGFSNNPKIMSIINQIKE